jgi:hydroxymethylglutaryl-CoA reductase (NADPH)
MSNKYTQAPGRGLMSNTAYELRMDYMNSLVDGIEKDLISETIGIDQIQNNIESFIGTIEIPLGLIGPLLFVDEKKETFAHTAIATTEGALAASMNRGAKAISECGGFRGHIVHQKMLRTPMFTFESMSHAMEFDHWIKQNFNAIKEITQKYSNYADLLEIRSVIVGKIVHLKFIYTTSDASGQNMTTSCTWHSCLWIEINFQEQSTVEILHFVIDGNGASDKKVSFYSIQNGRGIHVITCSDRTIIQWR